MVDRMSKGTTPEGFNLRSSILSPAPLHPDRCIICQKQGKISEPLHGGATGRKHVREVAEVKDDVSKRLKIVGLDLEFKYHNTYSCYKKNTNVRSLLTTSEDPAADEATEEVLADVTTHKTCTRCSTVPRPGPTTTVDSKYTYCVICACDRVWVKRKGEQVREKLRLCKVESGQKFLEAMLYRKEDVYVR